MKRQSVPLIPWTIVPLMASMHQPFVHYLDILGFERATQKLFARVPDQWTEADLMRIAMQLGSIPQPLIKR